jgi:hypothetical protein
VYDERYYLKFAEHVQTAGFREALTSRVNEHSSAVGPVYPALHLAVSRVTRIQPPAVRWVNFVGLLIVIAMLAHSLKSLGRSSSVVAAGSILAVPFLWASVGLALTELPALCIYTVFVYAILRLLRLPIDKPDRDAHLQAVVAGAILGLTILARQTYLVGVPAIAALVLVRPRQWTLWVTVLCVTALVSGWLFVLWGGLIPPSLQYQTSNISIGRGVLSLAYIAAATLLIDPRWLLPRSPKVLIGLIAAGAMFALLYFDWTDAPAQSMLRRLGGWMLPAGYCILVAMTSLAFVWLWNTAQRAWEDRADAQRVFLFLSLFALVAAPANGFVFSSRYVVGALGALVLVLDVPRPENPWLGLRILAGSAIGAISLLSYYRLA